MWRAKATMKMVATTMRRPRESWYGAVASAIDEREETLTCSQFTLWAVVASAEASLANAIECSFPFFISRIFSTLPGQPDPGWSNTPHTVDVLYPVVITQSLGTSRVPSLESECSGSSFLLPCGCRNLQYLTTDRRA